MNHNEDNDVKKALDDIFGSDFIEIDSNSDDNHSEEFNLDDSVEIKDEQENVSDVENNTLNINIPLISEPVIPEIVDSTNEDNDFEDKFIEKDTSADELQQVIENEKVMYSVSDNKNMKKQKNDKNVKKENNSYNNNALILYFMIGIILGTILILLFVNKNNNIEKKINCTYKAEDTGFKTTDEYTITYKGNKLIYIEGEYVYTAKTDEFKPQIDYIKEEKLPVIINSNGMSGFTHNYEISDNYYKVLSYYDISLFNFDIVDKNDSKITPISYIELNSKTTLKSLRANLEKNGYKCVNTN